MNTDGATDQFPKPIPNGFTMTVHALDFARDLEKREVESII